MGVCNGFPLGEEQHGALPRLEGNQSSATKSQRLAERMSADLSGMNNSLTILTEAQMKEIC